MLHMNTPPTPKSIRVTVPVSPEVLDVFQRLSKAAGHSVGRSMGEWLEGTMEGVVPMIDILERHKQAPKKAIQSLQLYAGTLQDMSNDLFDRVREMPTDGGDRAPALAAMTGTAGASAGDLDRAKAAGGPGLAAGESSKVASVRTGGPGIVPQLPGRFCRSPVDVSKG